MDEMTTQQTPDRTKAEPANQRLATTPDAAAISPTENRTPMNSPSETNGNGKTAHEAAQNGQKRRENLGGAPAGNINALKGNRRGHVVLGQAPKPYRKQYAIGRKRLKALVAEYGSKCGEVSTSIEEALIDAVIWLVRSLCLHRWARQPERTDAEQNKGLDDSAAAHASYINRLRTLGLAKPQGNGKGDADMWASLNVSTAPAEAMPDQDATDANPEAGT